MSELNIKYNPKDFSVVKKQRKNKSVETKKSTRGKLS